MVEDIFRTAKSLLATRPIFHKSLALAEIDPPMLSKPEPLT
jgi:hypothetical protein